MPRQVNEKIYKAFGKGTVNFVEAENISEGAASEANNFITHPDKLELTYGRKQVGNVWAGATPVLGLHSITKLDGTDLMLRKVSTYLQYYNPTTDLWVDIKTDLSSTAKMYFDNFYSPAGRQVWMNGEDGLFKLYPTHPASLLSMYDSTKNYKGQLRIEKSSMFVFGNLQSPTNLYRSKVDRDANYIKPWATYDATSGGVTTGTDTIVHSGTVDIKTGAKLTIAVVSTGTLPTGITAATTYWAIRVSATSIKLATSLANALAGTPVDITAAGTGQNKITVTHEYVGATGGTNYTGTLFATQSFGLLFTDGTKNITDNFQGTLSGDGTGTINYATGAFNVTFSSATGAAVYVSYLSEDPKTGGIADFTYSATRTAGEGIILRQDSTGTVTRNLITYDGTMYSLQDKGSWKLNIDSTDLIFSNQVYNNILGSASDRCAVAVSDGIIYIDVYDSANPKLRKLMWNEIGTQVVPRSLSEQFDLSAYDFDEAVSILFGKKIVISCKLKGSTANDKTIVYDLQQESFDVVKWGYTVFTIANNKLYGGDATSPNVYEVFSGFDDLDFTIEGEWIGKNDTLDTEQLKKVKRFIIEGYIAPSQSFEVYASYDKDDWSLLGTISGDESYVDTGRGVAVGSAMYAENMYGGEGDGTIAYFYKHFFRVRPPKFERVRIRFVPIGIGYLSVNQFKWSRIVGKDFKILKKYR